MGIVYEDLNTSLLYTMDILFSYFMNGNFCNLPSGTSCERLIKTMWATFIYAAEPYIHSHPTLKYAAR